MKLRVVIPCRNEEKHIEECIRAIFNSTLSNEIEMDVVVVDGKSDDDTLSIISQLKKEFHSLKMVINEQQLTPFAFNLGIKSGNPVDFVQIVGARQILSETYLLSAMNRLISNEEIGCVGGTVENVFLTEVGEVISKAMGTAFGMGLGNFRSMNESAFVDTVGTPMYRYSIFEEVGFFDEELIRNQDDEFNFRVTQLGKKIFLDTGISVKYYVRGDFQGLWRQFFQYGYWKVYVNKKHKAITTFRQLIPPLFVLYMCLLPMISFFGIFFFSISSIPFLLYILALVFFSIRYGKGQKEINQLGLSYIILHFSYGFGYLKGMAHFMFLNKKPSNKQKRLSR